MECPILFPRLFSRCCLADYVKEIELKSVPHVQHDYFSSFNQSDRCFLALSLPLPSLLKLSIVQCNRSLKLFYTLSATFAVFHNIEA